MLHISGAEPYLQDAYLSSSESSRTVFSSALSQCGSEQSLDILSKGCQSDYLSLLERLSSQGKGSLAVRKAIPLLKSSSNSIRIAALSLIVSVDGDSAWKHVFGALKSSDRKYRCSALSVSAMHPGLFDRILASYHRLPVMSRRNVLSWAGEARLSEATDLLGTVAMKGGSLCGTAIRSTDQSTE